MGLRAEEGWHRDLETDRHTLPELTALLHLDTGTLRKNWCWNGG
ncbi:hypothetical protein ACOT81_00100 [Streptomyces sp. WI04-05B]|nr:MULTISPECIES: hypothetical protein [unclassified Streptomyces]MDX2548764.1 hypothetical protein [Streptomyces sp. WI04-05B]MDX2590586.1 hypothetical protein [Streptomyces sp. WI04-05A]MDX3745721.1 hypothetical protein [Streptomyces sp. AK08-02]